MAILRSPRAPAASVLAGRRPGLERAAEDTVLQALDRCPQDCFVLVQRSDRLHVDTAPIGDAPFRAALEGRGRSSRVRTVVVFDFVAGGPPTCFAATRPWTLFRPLPPYRWRVGRGDALDGACIAPRKENGAELELGCDPAVLQAWATFAARWLVGSPKLVKVTRAGDTGACTLTFVRSTSEGVSAA